MKILFLNHCGKLGGAELCLLDTAKPYRDNCLLGLFADDGPLKRLLEQQHISVQVLATRPIQVGKGSSFVQGLSSVCQLLPLVAKVVLLSREYDLIYANTHKALIVGALASFFSHRPLVYRLHDILSAAHFSQANRSVAVTLANRFASLVIANSKATGAAFVEAGGRLDITKVVYNGFEPGLYQNHTSNHGQVRQQLGLDRQFLIGHFSRLSSWKGQHVLIEALAHCPKDVAAVFVGDAMFGEQDYVQGLHEQVAILGLEKRVRFVGFRSDVVPVMATCDLVAHTSTAPEPFGRVIVEAMLCARPVIAAQAGGVTELVEPGKTGWLVSPNDPLQLAAAITTCRNQPEQTAAIAREAQSQASQRFNLTAINQQIALLLCQINSPRKVRATTVL